MYFISKMQELLVSFSVFQFISFHHLAKGKKIAETINVSFNSHTVMYIRKRECFYKVKAEISVYNNWKRLLYEDQDT